MSDEASVEVMWRNGEIIPSSEARVHVLSHAAHRGSEVFDVLRVIEGPAGPSAVGLRPHVARFDRSMELMGMESPYDVATLEQAVAETVFANPGSSTVKLVAVWDAIAPTTIPVSVVPTIFVAALQNDASSIEIGSPVKIRTAVMPKIPATILPPALKVAAGYTPGVRQQLAAARDGFDDVIFRTAAGKLAEATSQSLLVVSAGRVLAPPLDSVLDGITRRLLIDLAANDGMIVEIRDVHWDEVESADELILNSTTRFVRPVGQLDYRELDAPGPVTRQLAGQVIALAKGDHPLTDRWLTPLASLQS